MKTSQKYNKPPIIEALCEIKFIPDQTWDMTIPGLIYKEVKNEFSERKQKMALDVKFHSTKNGLEHKVEPAPPRMQFHRKDGTGLIQIAPDLLVVNQLKPYPSWSKFKPKVIDILHIYKKIANPKGFKRIGLRYINRIDFESKKIGLGEYFNLYINLPKELPQQQTSCLARVEIPCVDNRDVMVVMIGTVVPKKPETIAIVLDIDYILRMTESVKLEQFEDWIENAHTAIEKAFEACINNKSRILFEEKK